MQREPDGRKDWNPDEYFEELDDLHNYAMDELPHIHMQPVALSYLLGGGIRRCYPEIHDRHALKINDRSFTWNSLFRDIVHDDLRYRFGFYSRSFPELEACENGPGFLGEMGIYEYWESVVEDAAENGEMKSQTREEGGY